MKVNMTPNPLDVVTIHASQGDTEARQWEFELHNNGELIDTSDVKEQLVFKAYKGGTEQLLPENTSTPTTSPFNGDIKYPQGLLADQEFTYRQSPTEEDGLAKITDIKGNTLNWNQLAQNGNFADGTNNWQSVGTSLTVANNEITIKLNADGGSRGIRQAFSAKANHKYLIHYFEKITLSASRPTTTRAFFYNSNDGSVSSYGDTSVIEGGYNEAIVIITPTKDYDYLYIQPSTAGSSPTTEDTYVLKNVTVFDLTQMGLDITDPSEFTSLFSLPYYAYNQGSLLSFNGNGIKTVGFNQWDEEWEVGRINETTGEIYNSGTQIRSKNFISCLPNTRYYLKYSLSGNNARIAYYDANKNYLNMTAWIFSGIFTTPNDACYMKFYMAPTYGTTYNNDICINISDPSKNGTYEPYTSSTLSLPISTYFPNGMDGVGTAYDELTNTKATKRMARADLGTLSYSYESAQGFFYATISDIVGGMTSATKPNVIIPGYSFKGETVGWANMGNLTYGFSGRQIRIRNESYTTVDSFKQAINGTEIVYPLATPTETSFTTASLVTENAEIPLSNEDGTLIGKCTEQLSENPGFIDAKIKLSDSDGECYSNKIQLHVERSPQ